MSDELMVWSYFGFGLLLAYGWTVMPPRWLSRAGVNSCLLAALLVALLLILRGSLISTGQFGPIMALLGLLFGAPRLLAHVAWIEGRISR